MSDVKLSVPDRYADQDKRWFPPMVVLDSEDQRATIHRLRDEAEAWLAGRGIDQYTSGPHSKSALAHGDIDRLFDAGQFVARIEDGKILAVVAITEPDADFWTAEEMAEPQAYLSRFLVAEHGRNHGADLLAAVKMAEIRRGSKWLRLDCWRTNKRLHEYYLRQGFQRVRTEVVPGRMSGELFQFDLKGRGTVMVEHDWQRI